MTLGLSGREAAESGESAAHREHRLRGVAPQAPIRGVARPPEFTKGQISSLFVRILPVLKLGSLTQMF